MIRLFLLSASLLAASTAQAKTHNAKLKDVVTYKVQTKDLFTPQTKKALKGSNASCQPGCVMPTPEIPPASGIVQNPQSPAVAFYPNANAQNAKVSPDQTLEFSFQAASPQFNEQQVGTPPDTMGAVGPEQFIVAINNGITSYNKHTGERDWVLKVAPSTFGNADGNFFLDEPDDAFDPRIRYDAFSERWYIMYGLAKRSAFADNGFYLAASDDKVITECTNWTMLYIPNATIVPDENGCSGDLGAFVDYPMLGIDRHAVYLSANIYPATTSNLGPSYTTVYVIPKKYLLSGDTPVITAFRNIQGVEHGSFNSFRTCTVQAVDNFDSDSEFGYFIGGKPQQYGTLTLFRVENPGSKHPSLVGPIPLTVPMTAGDYKGVPNASNIYGTSGLLEGQDDRPLEAHVRDSQLYTVHQVTVNKNGVALWDQNTQFALGDRKAARWYQIDLTGDSSGQAGHSESAYTAPALVQAGTLFDNTNTTTPLHYIYASIMTNKHGELVLSGTLCNETTYPTAFFVGRNKNDPLGTLKVGSDQKGVVFATGFGVFTRSLNSRGLPAGHQRWGDYTYVSLDPDDEKTMWSIQEVNAGSLESLWVAKIGSSSN